MASLLSILGKLDGCAEYLHKVMLSEHDYTQ